MIGCPSCGQETPEGNFCVRCGAPLSDAVDGASAGPSRGRSGFAAAPHQHRSAPWIVSTLFPHLPKASMASFRVGLLVGVAVVVALAAAGLFPVALAAAAVTVPLLTLIYVWDADVYEDEPALVIGLTLIAGILLGIGVTVLGRAIGASGSQALVSTTAERVWKQGVLVPVVGTVAMMVGPWVLLRYPRFNDVLDGTTFGVTSAVAFAGTQILANAYPLLSGGLRPGGRVSPWIEQLLALTIATPVITASVIGAAAGAFWLRYRAPMRDRSALGPMGNPSVALAVAALALVVVACVQVLLSALASTVVLLILVLPALVGLRRVIHIGLLEEAAERPIGPEIACPNCSAVTATHTFCGNCGISLAALPKDRRAHRRASAPTREESPA